MIVCCVTHLYLRFFDRHCEASEAIPCRGRNFLYVLPGDCFVVPPRNDASHYTVQECVPMRHTE